MDNRITLVELADAVARRGSMTKKDSEAFVRTFFETLKECLLVDGQVKVKGLGTFKFLPEDGKLSFTPEKALSDRINRPFADFESVVLHEGTSTEDMERIDETPEPEPEPADDVEPEPIVASTLAPIVEPEVEPAMASEPEPIDVVEPEPVEETEKIPEPEAPLEEPTTSVAPPQSGTARKVLLSLLFTLLIGGAIYGLYTSDCFRHKKTSHVAQAITPEATTDTTETSVTQDAMAEQKDSVQLEETETSVQPEAAPPQSVDPKRLMAEYPQIENGEYWITGTKTVHSLAKGEDLSRLALNYYGDKRLVSYIIRYNHYTAKQASNLFVGAEVKIPELLKRN